MHAKPKKRLGQVFLVNRRIQDRIIEAANLRPGDRVLEIGPGKGELTSKLICRVKKLVVVEIDRDLCERLKESFKNKKNIKVVNQDILKFNISDYFKKGKIKIIGNIPYYISTAIIEYLLSQRNRIEVAYLMLQKEFARRLVARAQDKDRSSLSCFVQFYTEPEILFYVKKGNFWPHPRVDSAFVKLKIRPEPIFSVKNEKIFFKIIRTSFSQRRKTLRNSLSNIVPEEKLKAFFETFGINPNVRAQELGLEDFAHLANSIA
ncbi:MAG: 16S rRNA (adenine(1518)-N(6)/adenine(1519)-N(6))-dimethyltransferase RsmA [Candidatus Omnitrophica bacterium]|nr:16S rRNA (adenine(1518)-N(6)/adenine(1519)-N(6))-dimethyltransferase RsmA [Candidatus Omnitrophota bacterium]